MTYSCFHSKSLGSIPIWNPGLANQAQGYATIDRPFAVKVRYLMQIRSSGLGGERCKMQSTRILVT